MEHVLTKASTSKLSPSAWILIQWFMETGTLSAEAVEISLDGSSGGTMEMT